MNIKTFLFGLLLTMSAQADYVDRILTISDAWNTHDIEGVQADFSRDLSVASSSASLAKLAEEGDSLFVVNSVELFPGFYGYKVIIRDRQEIWLMSSDVSGKWSGWWNKTPSLVGGAELGQGSDVLTTGIGVGLMGATEVNPLGLAILPLKYSLLKETYEMSFAQCVEQRTVLDATGIGAGIANMATLAASITSLPVSLGIFVLSSYMRRDGAMNKAIWDCAEMKL